MNFETYISQKMVRKDAKIPIDTRISVSDAEFICVWSPNLDKYALIRTDGSGMSGLGWCKKLTYEDVYKYYPLCTIKVEGMKPIIPGTRISGVGSKNEYSIAYSCGTWKLVNCVSGNIINTIKRDKCELNADDIRALIELPSMYVIDI